MLRILRCLLFLFFLGFSSLLYAHPHVFIDTMITVRFDESGIVGFQVSWIFDEMFSSMIIGDFDEDWDGSFSKKEIENILEGAFSNLQNFHYFTYISVNGKECSFSSVTEFTAAIQGEKIIYQFFIPCRIFLEGGEKTVKLAAYDETFYCDIAFSKEDPISLQNSDGYTVRYEIVQNKKNPIYGGQVFPFETRFYIRK
jgi:ABC-type uncharacterized transport system substrate-binding protein